MDGGSDGVYPASVRLTVGERVGEQGERGTCVAFSLVGLLEYYRGEKQPPLSPQFVYACCKADGGGTAGVDLLSAVASVRRRGVCTLEAWGYNPCDGDTQGQVDVSRLGEFPVEDCSAVPFHVLYSAGNISEYKAALCGAQGYRPMPVVIGVRVFDSVTSARNGWFPMYCDGETVSGYHALLVYGYRDTPGCPSEGYFMALNSWGREWSLCGMAKIPYEYVQRHGLAAVTIRAEENAEGEARAAAAGAACVHEPFGTEETTPTYAFSASPQGENERRCVRATMDVSPMAQVPAEALGEKTLTIALSSVCAMRFVKIHSGCFAMGSPAGEAGRFGNEGRRDVTISRDFWLGETPVTQRQYAAIAGGNPSSCLGEDCPVDMVSWEAAAAFCIELTRRATGQLPPGCVCMLPTEAEWEFACRADGSCQSLDASAWYEGNSGRVLHPVGQKVANAWGLHDMLGNVWEWCRDGDGALPADFLDPCRAAGAVRRIMRGGSAISPARYCRPAARLFERRTVGARAVGFRVALIPQMSELSMPGSATCC